MTRDSILFDEHTDLNHYQIVECIYNGRPARVLYSGGNRRAAQSGIPLDGKPEPLFDYNQRLMELIQGVRPKNLLVLGGGALTLPVAARQVYPKLLIDVVELDGQLPEISRQHFGFRSDRLLKIHIGDGLAFVKKEKTPYDMIIVDVFHDTVIPESFQTDEAMENLRQRMSKKGIVAINAIGALEGERSTVLRRLQAGLQAHFPKASIFPAAHGLSPWSVQNFIMTGWDKGPDPGNYLRYSPVNLAER